MKHLQVFRLANTFTVSSFTVTEKRNSKEKSLKTTILLKTEKKE